MSFLYFALAPLLFLSLIDRIIRIKASIENHRPEELKGHLVFLSLILIVSFSIIVAIGAI